MEEKSTDISVVIVSYKCLNVLRIALDAVRRSMEGLNVDVWVVDNASEDGTTEYLRTHYDWVNVVDAGGNLGFSKANNIALERCKGRVVLVLNPDTIMPVHFLKSVIEHFDKEPDCGAIGVQMTNGYGEYLKESKRGYPDVATSFFKLTGLWHLAPKSATLNSYYVGHLGKDETGEAAILSGACFAFTRELMEKVGVFDPIYFMYGEDIDLTWRMNIASRGNKYRGDLKIVHFKGVSTPRKMKYIYSFYDAMLLFSRRYEREKHNLVVNAVVALGVWVGFVMAAIKCVVLRTIESYDKAKDICRVGLVSHGEASDFASCGKYLVEPITMDDVWKGRCDKYDAVVFDTDTEDIDDMISAMQENAGRFLYGFYSSVEGLCVVFQKNTCQVLYDGKACQ